MRVATSSSAFTRLAQWTARASGRPAAFGISIAVVLVWAASGPLFHFSNTWQLVINTGTTIVTFLMVFLIQNTQYRDSEAVHVKLDELIRVTSHARNALMDLEDLEGPELDEIRSEYEALAERARKARRNRSGGPKAPGTGKPR